LVAADYYAVNLLVKHLSTWLAKNMKQCNALEVFVVATRHGGTLADPATARAAGYVGASLDQILYTEAFLTLPGDALVSLLSHVNLRTAVHEMKLHAAMAYVAHGPDTRACLLSALLSRSNLDDAPAASLAELLQSPIVAFDTELVTRIALAITSALCFRQPRPHEHRFYLDATEQGEWLVFFGPTGTVTAQRAQNAGHDGPRRSYEMPPTVDWTRLWSSSVPTSVSLAAAHDMRTGLVVLSDKARLHSQLVLYSLHSGTWKTLPPLPIPRTAYTLTCMSGYVYAIGGTTESGSLSREVARLRITGDGPSGQHGPNGLVWETMAPLHAARSGHTTTVMRAPAGTGMAIVVFGGSASTSAPIEWLAASGAGRWKQIWMSMPRHRAGHMAIAVPTRNKTAQLLVIGGETVHDEDDTSAFFVNIASGVITDNPALTEKYVASPCAVHAAGSNTVLVFGVYSPSSSMPVNVQSYNTETGASELTWCSAYTEGAAVVFA
jgi:hypothetical protein